MSEALQCERCKKFAVRSYDIDTDRFLGTDGWTVLQKTERSSLGRPITIYALMDLCAECNQDFEFFLSGGAMGETTIPERRK